MRQRHVFSAGFSLIELAIVLVILGLLVGTVITGKSLLHASEVKAIPVEFEKFRSVTFSFRNRYKALPGDMTNATDVWGATDKDPALCITKESTDTSTCNGDGDGRIYPQAEGYLFWKHLSDAGMLEGSYTGIAGPGSIYDANPGKNVPKSKIKNAVWDVYYAYRDATNPWWFAAQANLFFVGSKKQSTTYAEYPLLTAKEALEIDTIMDDSKPGTGKVKSHKQGSEFTPTCATATDPAVGSSRVDLQACKLEYSIVSPK